MAFLSKQWISILLFKKYQNQMSNIWPYSFFVTAYGMSLWVTSEPDVAMATGVFQTLQSYSYFYQKNLILITLSTSSSLAEISRNIKPGWKNFFFIVFGMWILSINKYIIYLFFNSLKGLMHSFCHIFVIVCEFLVVLLAFWNAAYEIF